MSHIYNNLIYKSISDFILERLKHIHKEYTFVLFTSLYNAEAWWFSTLHMSSDEATYLSGASPSRLRNIVFIIVKDQWLLMRCTSSDRASWVTVSSLISHTRSRPSSDCLAKALRKAGRLLSTTTIKHQDRWRICSWDTHLLLSQLTSVGESSMYSIITWKSLYSFDVLHNLPFWNKISKPKKVHASYATLSRSTCQGDKSNSKTHTSNVQYQHATVFA